MRILLLPALLATSCVAHAVSPLVSIPKERATECVQNCAALDMRLTAVVLMANSAGCVCEPRGESSAVRAGARTAAGAVTIAAIEQEQQRQEQERQEQQRPGQPQTGPAPTPPAYCPPGL